MGTRAGEPSAWPEGRGTWGLHARNADHGSLAAMPINCRRRPEVVTRGRRERQGAFARSRPPARWHTMAGLRGLPWGLGRLGVSSQDGAGAVAPQDLLPLRLRGARGAVPGLGVSIGGRRATALVLAASRGHLARAVPADGLSSGCADLYVIRLVARRAGLGLDGVQALGVDAAHVVSVQAPPDARHARHQARELLLALIARHLGQPGRRARRLGAGSHRSASHSDAVGPAPTRRARPRLRARAPRPGQPKRRRLGGTHVRGGLLAALNKTLAHQLQQFATPSMVLLPSRWHCPLSRSSHAAGGRAGRVRGLATARPGHCMPGGLGTPQHWAPLGPPRGTSAGHNQPPRQRPGLPPRKAEPHCRGHLNHTPRSPGQRAATARQPDSLEIQ